MKAVVFTLGCKVNSCESAAITNMLTERGYEVSSKLGYADLFIINTCAVTAEAEKKSRQAVARARKFNKNCKIIITGCASQNAPNSFWGKENVTLVTGARQKSRLVEMIDTISGAHIANECAGFDDMQMRTNGIRHFLKIQDGCDNFCSYCIIPYLRGRENDRSKLSILEEARATNALEIVLTGINISSYDKGGEKLTGLISELKPIKKRIRLGSLEANVIDDDFLKACKNLYDFAPHFHLSLQSGSEKVLKDMNRKYTPELFIQKCEKIRQYFSNAAITTDIIAAYPTETQDDFNKTINLCEEVKFSSIHAFVYSARKGTMAANLKELDDTTKSHRLNKLKDIAKKLSNDYINKNINETLTVIFEEQDLGLSVGYSQNYIRVYARAPINQILKIKAQKPYKDGIFGVLGE